jgi:glycerol-1-phosphate dehydrogenase [NAD(P)+]
MAITSLHASSALAESRSRAISIPSLMEVSAACLDSVAALLVGHSFDLARVCIGSGNGPSRGPADRVDAGLRASGVDTIRVEELDGRLEQAAELAASIISEDVSLVLGVGGGRVIDTAKLAAARTGVDFVSIPTTISHDGICSPVASLRQADGLRESYAAAMPAGIIVDVEVIGSSPARALRAGVGDLASNLTAILDWQLADRLGHDRFDAFAAMIAESAARPALDLVELSKSEDHEVLAKGLLLSGLAMAAAGTSRPCSGAEHLVSHSLDRILGSGAAMHGEQVALGCLLSAAAHGSPLLETLHELFATLGLPRRPSDLGLSDELMLEALREAPSTRPDRYTILSEMDIADGGGLLERAFA